MVTDLFNLLVILAIVGFGFKRPHVSMAGAAWINIYQPQTTSYGFLAGAPLSLLLTAFFVGTLFINRSAVRLPKSKAFLFLVPLFCLWISISTAYAEFPGVAQTKFDIAIKTISFAFFIPFVLIDREKVETFVWILVCSFGYFVFLAGTKSAFGGGGYGVSLIGIGKFMWSEGSTLSTVAICMVPFFYFASKYTALAKQYKYFRWLMWLFMFLALLVPVGTQARTGLVALAAFLGVLFLITSFKNRVKIVAIFCCAVITILPLIPDSWFDRMNTLSNVDEEKSAIGRLVVWRWTIDYAAERPWFGGGFYAYLANAGQLDRYADFGEASIRNRSGKAFHSIYFEVLGEHGYAGLLIFLSMLVHGAMNSWLKFKSSEYPEWVKQLGICLFLSFVVYSAGGLFIGVAFLPLFYYLYALSISLNFFQKDN